MAQKCRFSQGIDTRHSRAGGKKHSSSFFVSQRRFLSISLMYLDKTMI